MRSWPRALTAALAFPLVAGLVVPVIQWCRYDWAQLPADCVVRCAVAPAPVCQRRGSCDEAVARASATPPPGRPQCGAVQGCPARNGCPVRNGCPLASGRPVRDGCEAGGSVAEAAPALGASGGPTAAGTNSAPVRRGRAFCLGGTAGGPAVRGSELRVPEMPSTGILLALLAPIPAPVLGVARREPAADARPPTLAWRILPPARAPPCPRMA